jgi:hypothetical protein
MIMAEKVANGMYQMTDFEYQRVKDDAVKAEKFSTLRSAMRDLLNVVKNSLVTLWWVMGIAFTVALWFYPLEANRLQAIFFCGASIVYALISRGLYKVKEVQARYES